MKLASFAVLLAITCTSVLAHADDQASPSAEQPPSYRSEKEALVLSLAGTAASAAMFGIGMATDNETLTTAGALSSIVTPSLGHWYACDMLTAGMGLRAAGGVVAAFGLVSELGCWENCTEEDSSSSKIIIGIGLTSYVAGTIYDIATAPKAAREHNDRFRITSVAPTPMQSANGQVSMGIGLGGTF